MAAQENKREERPNEARSVIRRRVCIGFRPLSSGDWHWLWHWQTSKSSVDQLAT